MNVIFLDIDGVLLSTVDWDLPGNVRLLQENDAKMMTIAEFSSKAQFNSVSVMLINRLCHQANVRIVISSSWRYSPGVEETRQKLEHEGIDVAHFHNDYACPVGRPLAKERDIRDWLTAHRRESPRSLAIDDETLPGIEQVITPHDSGFGLDAYRYACGWFGGVDTRYGVHAVADDDLALMRRFFDDEFAVIRWLFVELAAGKTRSARLDSKVWQKYGAEYAERRRCDVWDELPLRR